MNLYLSSTSPINTRYTNQYGQALYIADTPGKMPLTRTTRIRKIIPSDQPLNWEEDAGDVDMRDDFELLATIRWHFAESDVTLSKKISGYKFEQFSTKDFLKHAGWNWNGW